MNYATHVFDVDGVLIDSNGVKSRAFYAAALPYGEAEARRLVEYHQQAGSIGRDARWRWFFREVLHREATEAEFAEAMRRTTQSVLEGTLDAPLVPGVEEYLAQLGPERSVVVSGIEQSELEQILAKRGLACRFREVYGGPRTKGVLLKDLTCTGVITTPAVYYGDVEEDYLASRNAGLDFVWVRGCSEWPGLRTIDDFRDLRPDG